MNFNLKQAGIYQAVKRQRAFGLVKIFKNLFFILFVISFLLFLYGFFGETFSQSFLSNLLGLSIVFLTLTIGGWWKVTFFSLKLKKPKIKEKTENLAEFLSFEVAKAINKSKKNSTPILYNLLSDNPKLNFVFSRVLLNPKEIKKVLKDYLGKVRPRTSPPKDFQELISEALKIAQKKGHLRIEEGDMLAALAKHDLIFKKILVDSNLKVSDIENLTWWLETLEERAKERKKFWLWKNLIKRGSLAKAWAAGFTINLDRFGIDFSEIVKKQGFPETVGHQKELKAVERVLARREINNCLLIGEPGVGRKSMILALAKRSTLGESLPKVNYKRVVQLDLPTIAAQTKTSAEAEGVLDAIFQEVVKAGNIILVIDDFHNFVGGKDRPGVIDVSGVLSPYLNLPQFQVVALTSFAGLHKNIEQRPSILSLLEKVEISEISERETLMILENLVLYLERKYKKFVSFPALREIVTLTKRYMPAIPFPKSAMDLLDEVMVYISSTKEKVVLPKHVASIVSEKTEIPVGEV